MDGSLAPSLSAPHGDPDIRGLTADSPDEFGTWLMQRYDIASTVASAYILLQRAQ